MSAESQGSPLDAPLALRMVKEEFCVDLLVNRVLNEARKTVFGELRGVAVVIASLLAIFGITSWLSIDEKVSAQVDKQINAELKEQLAKLKADLSKAENEVSKVFEGKKAVENRLAELARTSEESKRTLKMAIDEFNHDNMEYKRAVEEFQTILVQKKQAIQRTEQFTSVGSSLPTVFGTLPKATYFAAASGSADDFGRASGDPTGGLFTRNFLKVIDAPDTDRDRSGAISFAEVCLAARREISVLGIANPVYGGDDFDFFVSPPNNAQSLTEGVTYLIAVGVNRVSAEAYGGWTGSDAISGCDRDAERFVERCTSPGGALYCAAKLGTALLTSDQATEARVRSAIRNAIDAAQENDVIIFYYAGVGVMDRGGASGTRANIALFDKQIVIQQLIQELSASRAKHRAIIIDG